MTSTGARVAFIACGAVALDTKSLIDAHGWEADVHEAGPLLDREQARAFAGQLHDVAAALLQVARERIESLSQTIPEALPDVQMMVSFLDQVSTQRGIVRLKNHHAPNKPVLSSTTPMAIAYFGNAFSMRQFMKFSRRQVLPQ